MIKVPATEAGIVAVAELTARGVSVNITLLFGVERYEQAIEAYMLGLERRARSGLPLAGIRSVASFFVSRVDSEIDSRLDKIGTPEAAGLRGKAAIANARLAYQKYEQVFSGDRWERLEALDARPQRPLWASTGVKDPSYDDTRYVVELVAPGTVNTMPEGTLQAVADHGVIRGNTIRGSYAEAQQVFDDLTAVGVDLDDAFGELEADGAAKFQASWRELQSDVAQALGTGDPS